MERVDTKTETEKVKTIILQYALHSKQQAGKNLKSKNIPYNLSVNKVNLIT